MTHDQEPMVGAQRGSPEAGDPVVEAEMIFKSAALQAAIERHQMSENPEAVASGEIPDQHTAARQRQQAQDDFEAADIRRQGILREQQRAERNARWAGRLGRIGLRRRAS